MANLKRKEEWKISYDRQTNMFTIDFGENFAVKKATQASVEYFFRWRLQKIRNNEISLKKMNPVSNPPTT